MQPTNKAKPFQASRCMYCGSTTRGKGCRYGPHGVHFHPDDPKKCAYCGSSNYGKGCKVNPTAELHVHGINYNSMFKEQLSNFLKKEILLYELKKPYTEFVAYKLGLIDDSGNKLKSPTTVDEQAAFNPFTKIVLKLKRFLGPKLDLINASNLLQKNTLNEDQNIERYKKVLEFKDKIDGNVNELFKILEDAHSEGLSINEIYNLIDA